MHVKYRCGLDNYAKYWLDDDSKPVRNRQKTWNVFRWMRTVYHQLEDECENPHKAAVIFAASKTSV